MSMTMLRATAVLFATLGLAGCGAKPPAQSTVNAPQANPEGLEMGVTGIPIDPRKKTVVILTAPAAARTPAEQMSQLQVQNARTQAQIASRMQAYSRSLGSSGSRQRQAAAMAGDLEAYKQQSLQMYKLQQQLPETQAEATE